MEGGEELQSSLIARGREEGNEPAEGNFHAMGVVRGFRSPNWRGRGCRGGGEGGAGKSSICKSWPPETCKGGGRWEHWHFANLKGLKEIRKGLKQTSSVQCVGGDAGRSWLVKGGRDKSALIL